MQSSKMMQYYLVRCSVMSMSHLWYERCSMYIYTKCIFEIFINACMRSNLSLIEGAKAGEIRLIFIIYKSNKLIINYDPMSFEYAVLCPFAKWSCGTFVVSLELFKHIMLPSCQLQDLILLWVSQSCRMKTCLSPMIKTTD